MSARLASFFGFVIILVLLGTSLYLQYFKNIMPCPLCTLQRLCFLFIGVFFFVGIFVYSKFIGRLFIPSLISVLSLAGIGLAGRQIWLQHITTDAPNECGLSLQYMLQALPVNEVFHKIFAGSAECTQRGWEFLYLDMAEWSLFWFVVCLALSIYVMLKKRQLL